MKSATDWSPLAHGIIAMTIMFIFGIPAGNLLAGACLGAGVFIGREHAQAEYRWMFECGPGFRTGWESLGAFNPAVWSIGSALDFLVPVLFCVALLFMH